MVTPSTAAPACPCSAVLLNAAYCLIQHFLHIPGIVSQILSLLSRCVYLHYWQGGRAAGQGRNVQFRFPGPRGSARQPPVINLEIYIDLEIC